MTKIAKILLFCVLTVALPFMAGAQRSGYVISPKNGEVVVSQEYVRGVVDYLCAPSLGGRATGSHGAVKVASWLDSQFSAAGLEYVGGAYLQGFKADGALARNVIGVIPGKTSKVVIVMAHYDNLGTLGDTFYPGADSNASGVAALLQLVKMLLNPDSVIPCISYLSELLVSPRLDNRPSLSSSNSMINLLRGPSQGKSHAGKPPSCKCSVDLNSFNPLNIHSATLKFHP